MAGNSTTTLNPGSGGDSIYNESLSGGAKMSATKVHTGALGVDDGPVTLANPLPVAVTSIPTGAATEAKQDTGNASLASLVTAAGLLATQATLALVVTGLDAVLAKLTADPSTATLQSTANTLLTAIRDRLPSALIGGRVDVNLGAVGVTVPISGAVTTSGTSTVSGTVAVSNFPSTQTIAGAVTVTSAPTTAITAAALPLPSGAATAALQGAGLPGALGAGGGVKVDGSGTPLPISGSVTVSSAPTTAVTIAALPALAAGSATIGKVDQGTGGASAWKVDGSAVTQPVSGALSVSNFPSTQAVSLATAPPLVASSALIGHVISDSGSTTVITALPALATGSNTIGAVTGPAAAALATAANQTTMATTLTSILSRLVAGLSSALKVDTAGTTANYDKQATLPIGGKILKVGPGTLSNVQGKNSTGGAGFIQLHDLASGSPAAGAQPNWYSTTSVANGSFFSSAIGGQVYGTPVLNGICLIFSTTQDTYTAVASSSLAYVAIYL